MIHSALQPAVAFVTQMLMTAARLSHVGELPGLLTKIPHPVLISGHCLAVAGMTKQSYSGRLISYVLVRYVVPRLTVLPCITLYLHAM